jgi:hypothetical protein
MVTKIQNPEHVSYGIYSTLIHVAACLRAETSFFTRTFSPFPIKPTHLSQVPVKHAVNYYDYVAPMINERICTQHWWNNAN